MQFEFVSDPKMTPKIKHWKQKSFEATEKQIHPI